MKEAILKQISNHTFYSKKTVSEVYERLQSYDETISFLIIAAKYDLDPIELATSAKPPEKSLSILSETIIEGKKLKYI